jgi:hypothetical protein
MTTTTDPRAEVNPSDLTDDEIDSIQRAVNGYVTVPTGDDHRFARAIAEHVLRLRWQTEPRRIYLPSVRGVTRHEHHKDSLTVVFSRRPTDDEMFKLHKLLQQRGGA